MNSFRSWKKIREWKRNPTPKVFTTVHTIHNYSHYTHRFPSRKKYEEWHRTYSMRNYQIFIHMPNEFPSRKKYKERSEMFSLCLTYSSSPHNISLVLLRICNNSSIMFFLQSPKSSPIQNCFIRFHSLSTTSFIFTFLLISNQKERAKQDVSFSIICNMFPSTSFKIYKIIFI